VSDSAGTMWSEFIASSLPQARAAAGVPFTSWAFGDSPEMADRLLSFVLSGGKRATCGSLWGYEARAEAPPVPGEFSVVLDGAGVARCVFRTTSVDIVAFDDVGADFARDEGEGDLSLDYWRAGHWAYFERELCALGLKPSGDMPLVCERFEVVYPSLGSSIT
jgi:uncharacterized protein YhfF